MEVLSQTKEREKKMTLEYNREYYEFKFIEFLNPYFTNPAITDTTAMLFLSKKHALTIEGPAKANGDYSSFKEKADPTKMVVHIDPEDPDRIWTEALITNLTIIPCGSEDRIRINVSEGGFTPHLADVLKRDHFSPVLKRALIGIKEADKVIRKIFPGYCLTEREIK